MRSSNLPGLPGVLGDERGVALPLALLGLVSVSILVTTAMVTSSTELAISSAHQDATRGLYVAEGGLQAFVAENGLTLGAASEQGEIAYVPPGGAAGEAVTVTVAHLGDQPLSGGAELRIFSVTARAQNGGGRSVMTLARQTIPPSLPLGLNLNSAVTVGGDLHVNGNAFTISGRSDDACSVDGGVQAVEHAIDSKISANNTKHWENFIGVDSLGNNTSHEGAVKNSGLTKAELAARVLGLAEGQILDDLVARIPDRHKWGPAFSPEGGPVRKFDGKVDTSPHGDAGVAVVDADGGIVELSGVSGLLIVLNGDLRMKGNASFTGAIIVEGNFTLSGSPTVTGALISLDETGENEIELDESAIGNGHVTVQFDACAVQMAEDSYGNVAESDQPPTVLPTTGWFEVTG